MGTCDAGSLIADRYRLEHKLGEGGMGTVWAATDTKLRRPVAIKMVAAHVSRRDAAAQRFEREAMAVARLKSPHIIEVHDYGVSGGHAYMVMELLEGEALSRRLAREAPVSLGAAAQWARELGRALMAAHGAGIVHRDLKPANIFLVRHQDEEMVKVIDFGIAKALTKITHGKKDLTTEGSLLGTPRYMAPEQLRGASTVDHRADLWSVAVILYRAVTGRAPFDGDHPGQIIGTILTEPATPPSQLRDGLPAELDEFFARALAKDPNDRYQDARELGHAFLVAAGSSDPSYLDHAESNAALPPPEPPDVTEATRHTPSVGAADQASIEAETLTLPTPTTPKRRTGVWLGAAASLLLGGVLAVFLVSGGGSDDDAASTSPSLEPALGAAPSAEPAVGSASATSAGAASAGPSASTTGSTVSADGGVPARPPPRARPARREKRPAPSPPPPKPAPSTEPKSPGSDSDLFSSPW